METIVAAVITAIGSFLAGYWPQRVKRRRAEQDIRRAETAVALLNKPSTPTTEREASYRVDTIEKITSFDENGDGMSTKIWRGVRTDQAFQNLKIPFRLRAVCHEAGLERPVVDELPGSGRTVSLGRIVVQHQDSEQALIEGEIVVNGQIGPETPPVHFKLVSTFKKSFCMTREEMVGAYKDADFKEEFSVQDVIAPTEKLMLIVKFPPSHHDLRPSPSATVLFSGTELMNQSETQRIRHNLVYDGGEGKLEVNEPRQGLAYGISWTPPRTKPSDT